jgi:PKD repeat protein
VAREGVRQRFRAILASVVVAVAALAVAAPGAWAAPSVTVAPTTATVRVNQPVTLTATTTTDPGETAIVAWTLGDGATGSGSSVTHAYAAVGTYTVTVAATAGNSPPATATATVHVVGDPSAAFSSTPAVATIGQAVSFDATGSSDPLGAPIASYAWDFGDGDKGTGATPAHGYAKAGDKTVTLTVAAADGRTASVSHAVHVDAPPVAGFDVAPAAPQTGDTITLTSTASDPDGAGDLASISWDLNGDGTYGDATGATAKASFLTAGTYTVGQRVTDKAGATATVTKAIKVTGSAAPAPVPPAGTSEPVAVVASPGAPVVAVSSPSSAAPPAATAALKLLRVRVQLAGSVTAGQTLITRLMILAPRGAQVVARCRGARKGCPARGVRQKIGAGGQVRLKAMERRLQAGAMIVVSVAKPGFATRRIVMTIRDGRAPARRESCLVPAGGTAREGRCPAA